MVKSLQILSRFICEKTIFVMKKQDSLLSKVNDKQQLKCQ